MLNGRQICHLCSIWKHYLVFTFCDKKIKVSKGLKNIFRLWKKSYLKWLMHQLLYVSKHTVTARPYLSILSENIDGTWSCENGFSDHSAISTILATCRKIGSKSRLIEYRNSSWYTVK